MKIIVKPKFKRNLQKIRDAELRLKLDAKITQFENAKSISQITGLKLKPKNINIASELLFAKKQSGW